MSQTNTSWQARLEEAAANREFQEFVKQYAAEWCAWKRMAVQTISAVKLAPPDETPGAEDRRWDAIGKLESDPNYQPAAVAGDPRLSLTAKCVLLAIWWYAERKSRALCPTATAPASAAEPLEIMLTIIYIEGADRASVDFTDIGTIAGDVIDAVERKHSAQATPLDTARDADEDVRDAGQRVKWRDVAERLERLRASGERFKGAQHYVDLLGCGRATYYSAARIRPPCILGQSLKPHRPPGPRV